MDDDDTGSPPVSRQFSLKPVRGMLFLIGLFAALCLASVPLSIWVLTQGNREKNGSGQEENPIGSRLSIAPPREWFRRTGVASTPIRYSRPRRCRSPLIARGRLQGICAGLVALPFQPYWTRMGSTHAGSRQGHGSSIERSKIGAFTRPYLRYERDHVVDPAPG
jgi:hypothetical protein